MRDKLDKKMEKTRMSFAEAHKDDTLLEWLEFANTEALCNHSFTLMPFGFRRNGVTEEMIKIAKQFEDIKDTDAPIEDFYELHKRYKEEMDTFLSKNKNDN